MQVVHYRFQLSFRATLSAAKGSGGILHGVPLDRLPKSLTEDSSRLAKCVTFRNDKYRFVIKPIEN